MPDPCAALIPVPRKIERGEGWWVAPTPLGVQGHAEGLTASAGRLALAGVGPELVEGGDVLLEIGSVPGPGDEAYTLEVSPSGARVRARAERGLAHGLRTLAQLLRQGECVPCLRIEDHPDLSPRGVMLDVSRDRVPTMATLHQLVDRLSACKVDHLELYVEHTFAYAGHEVVWADASPLTPDEIRELDAYCAARGVRLVPNQNSFGHLHRWLRLDEYRHLAECPEGVEHAFAREPEPFGLCPSDPRALEFLAGLYDQLLPCFGGTEFNVGLDETIDLGKGRSRERCERDGTGRVYLDFLLEVHRMVAERGRRMTFWGDIVLEHPELVEELPRDVIGLLWGYEAGHPFDANAAAFAAAGVEFRVCPGTSSWQSLIGRVDNARANLAEAAAAGVAHGARGWLVTDWGDFGHWQPYAVAWPGLLLGASRGWNAAAEPGDLAAALDLHVFQEAGPGEVLLRLGEVHRLLESPARNATSVFHLLRRPEATLPSEWSPGLNEPGLVAYLDELEGELVPRVDELGLGFGDLAVAARLSACAARLGRARLSAGPGTPLAAIPGAERSQLAEELERLAARHREEWSRTSRPGGLMDSARKILDVAEQLRA